MRIHQRYLVIYERKKPFKWIRIETKNYSMLGLVKEHKVISGIDCCSILVPYKLHLKMEGFLNLVDMKSYNSLQSRMHDLLYGFISGFPPCCISEFVRRAPRYPHAFEDPDDFVRCGFHCRKRMKEFENRN